MAQYTEPRDSLVCYFIDKSGKVKVFDSLKCNRFLHRLWYKGLVTAYKDTVLIDTGYIVVSIKRGLTQKARFSAEIVEGGSRRTIDTLKCRSASVLASRLKRVYVNRYLSKGYLDAELFLAGVSSGSEECIHTSWVLNRGSRYMWGNMPVRVISKRRVWHSVIASMCEFYPGTPVNGRELLRCMELVKGAGYLIVDSAGLQVHNDSLVRILIRGRPVNKFKLEGSLAITSQPENNRLMLSGGILFRHDNLFWRGMKVELMWKGVGEVQSLKLLLQAPYIFVWDRYVPPSPDIAPAGVAISFLFNRRDTLDMNVDLSMIGGYSWRGAIFAGLGYFRRSTIRKDLARDTTINEEDRGVELLVHMDIMDGLFLPSSGIGGYVSIRRGRELGVSGFIQTLRRAGSYFSVGFMGGALWNSVYSGSRYDLPFPWLTMFEQVREGFFSDSVSKLSIYMVPSLHLFLTSIFHVVGFAGYSNAGGTDVAIAGVMLRYAGKKAGLTVSVHIARGYEVRSRIPIYVFLQYTIL